MASKLTMLRRTIIFALVFLSGQIHGRVQKKASMEATDPELSLLEGGRDGQRLEADGSASMKIKVDLSVLEEKLDSMPQLENEINLLVQKFDRLTTMLGGQAREPSRLIERIATMEKVILDGITQQETRFNSILHAIQALKGGVGSIAQAIAQVLTILRSINSESGADRACVQQGHVIERLIQKVMTMLEQVTQQIENSGQREGNVLPTILQQVQQSVNMLRQNNQIIQTFDNRISGDVSTCSGLSDTQTEISRTLESLVTQVHHLPRQILSIIHKNAGSQQEVLNYLVENSKLGQRIQMEIGVVKDIVIQRTRLLETYLNAQKQEFVVVKRIFNSQSHFVQSSAKAAIAASRALKCHRS